MALYLPIKPVKMCSGWSWYQDVPTSLITDDLTTALPWMFTNFTNYDSFLFYYNIFLLHLLINSIDCVWYIMINNTYFSLQL